MFLKACDFSPDHFLLLTMAALQHLDLLLQPSDFCVDALGAAGHLLPFWANLRGFGHIFLSSHVMSDESLAALTFTCDSYGTVLQQTICLVEFTNC